jgi:hypothetical protein
MARYAPPLKLLRTPLLAKATLPYLVPSPCLLAPLMQLHTHPLPSTRSIVMSSHPSSSLLHRAYALRVCQAFASFSVLPWTSIHNSHWRRRASCMFHGSLRAFSFVSSHLSTGPVTEGRPWCIMHWLIPAEISFPITAVLMLSAIS